LIKSNRETVTLLAKLMGCEVSSTVSVIKVSLPEFRITGFVCCEVSYDLPNEEYFVILGRRTMLVRKKNGDWVQGGLCAWAVFTLEKAMEKHCDEGRGLMGQYKKKLNDWGSAEVNKRAAELIVGGVGHAASSEIMKRLKDAEYSLHKARQIYVLHVANCLACSRKLLVPI